MSENGSSEQRAPDGEPRSTRVRVSRATPADGHDERTPFDADDGDTRTTRTKPPRVLEPTVHGTVRRGSRIGSKRVVMPRGRSLLRMIAPRHWLATPEADRTDAGRFERLRRMIFGARLSSAAESEERLDKKRALAVFASDALSSTAYATEEILLVLVLAGSLYLDLALPVAMAIAVLLAVVALSYRQTVYAYPQGGGAYSVASDNFGTGPALVGAAAILTDYVLTVAVSISAGTLAIISALPELAGYEVYIALTGLVLITAINLRGVRESGSIFSVLTYAFLFSFGLMVTLGVIRLTFGGMGDASLTESAEPPDIVPVTSIGVFLILRAFSSGSTALTGLESIANGIQAFRAPESKNAATTMMLMAGILAFFFIGATFLAVRLGIVPEHDNSVISQIGRGVFGGSNPFYFLLQASTAMVLMLAANTAFNGFPRLAALLAKDNFMPRRFGFLDDRLTFSVGIFVLALISSSLLVLFQADTHRLIPLYAIGVFTAFTISQAGMVVHWRRLGASQHRGSMTINLVGAVATGVVALVIAATKFTHGAWMVIILIPALVYLLRSIRHHYRHTYGLIRIPEGEVIELTEAPAEVSHQPMLIPVRRIDRLVVFAVEYARSMSDNVTAVHVRREGEDPAEEFVQRWERRFPEVPIVVVESPYRTFLGPFLSYVDSVLPEDGSILTIVVPEFEIVHWWERILHNSTARLIGRAASKRPRVIVTSASARPGWMP